LRRRVIFAFLWENKKRAIEVVERGEVLKLLGEIQAGEPIESYEVPEKVELPGGIFDPRLILLFGL